MTTNAKSVTSPTPSCYVCLHGEKAGALMHGGCACRGTSGFAHLSCFIQAATHSRHWQECPTCGQRFTGKVQYNLARTLWLYTVDRPHQDRDKLIAQDLLAGALREANRLEEALPLLEDCVAVKTKYLGPGHIETLGSMNHLALLIAEMNRPRHAATLFQETLVLMRRSLGHRHVITVACMSNQANFLLDTKEYSKAEPLLYETLAIRRDTLPDPHPHTLSSLNSLALLLEKKGDYKSAEPLYLEAVEGARRLLGDSHPQTMLFKSNYAYLLYKQGKLCEAEHMLVEAFTSQRKLLGLNHPHTRTTHSGLVVVRRALLEKEFQQKTSTAKSGTTGTLGFAAYTSIRAVKKR